MRSSAPQPRDARIEEQSTGDFADFIKSTGPAEDYPEPPRPVRNLSGLDRGVDAISVLPTRAASSAGRAKLQARDAVVSRDDGISDLIDFVRSGPQLERENHRIPRTVAPFRTTMDSDQLSDAIGGKAVDASFAEPRYSQASTPVHSSFNSQSALLNSSTKPNNPHTGQHKNFDDEDMMPKRKTRKVRDMYQIDFSDEEDDEEYEASSRRPPVEEESLADFLRNAPPPEPTRPPVLEIATRSSSKVKRKSSTPGIMSRFSRQQPKSSDQGPHHPSSGTRVSHIPINVQLGSNYRPASGEPARGYVAQPAAPRNRVVQKSYQPRDAVYPTTRTSDLAAFLRDSEPPSAMQTHPQTFTPTIQREEASTFQRVFGRKKVH